MRKKMRKKRKSLASLLLSEARVQHIYRNLEDTGVDDAQRGAQLLHSVLSFHSFLCLFFLKT